MTKLLHPPEGVHAFTVVHPHEYDGKTGVDCPACVAAVDAWSFDQRGGWRIEEVADAQKSKTGREQAGSEPPEDRPVAEDEAPDPFLEGKAAAEEGHGRSANPYDGRSKAGKAWSEGWDAAEK